MRKRLGLVLLGFFGVLALVLISIAIINQFDPPLKTEVQKILSNEPQYTETQKRAYFYLLALYTGATGGSNELEKKGEELWTHHEETDFWRPFYKIQPWANQFQDCRDVVCGVKYLEASPQLVDELAKYKNQIQAYVRLMEYGEAADLFNGNQHAVFSPVQTVPHTMHRLFLLQMAQWLRSGGEERVLNALISSNHYMSSFLNRGSLLQRMIALNNLKMNADFIQVEAERNLAAQVSRELVESISLPAIEDFMFGAIEDELRTFHRIVNSIGTAKDLTLSALSNGETGDSLRDRSLGLISIRSFIRRNETLNKYWDVSMQRLSTDCPEEKPESECIPAARWSQLNYPWDYLVNPLGKRLVQLMSLNVGRTRARAKERLEALGRTKIELTARVH